MPYALIAGSISRAASVRWSAPPDVNAGMSATSGTGKMAVKNTAVASRISPIRP